MQTSAGPPRERPRLTASDVAHLDFVEHVFLPEAIRRRLVGFPQDAALKGLVRQLVAEATAGADEQADLRPATCAYQWPAVNRPCAPVGTLPPQQPPAGAPRPSSPFQRWWSRTIRAVGSDLAVHGLAYVGVVLFFVGAFGLVAFAFADVTRGLRPLAEVVIATAPFAAGALLRRRSAEAVGRSLELAGGLVLPIMVVTALLDGVGFPPDLSGSALVVALTLLLVALAGLYAAWSRRHVDSAVRFLVAPVVWLAVALATMGLGRPIPIGKAVATPTAAQVAAMTVALAATLGWARLRPTARLAAPTMTAALPGSVVIGVLAGLTWAAEGWPATEIVVTGIAGLVALECLERRVPPPVVGVAQPAWWALVWMALAGAVVTAADAGAVTLFAVVGFLALLEVGGARCRPPGVLVVSAAGAGLALMASVAGDLRWATGTLAAAAVWAAVRRTSPYGATRSAPLLDLTAGVLPLAAFGAFAVSRGEAGGGSAVVVGALVLLGVAVPAARGWLDRTPGEAYWRVWWSVGFGVVGLTATVRMWSVAGTAQVWACAAALAFLASGALVSPLRPAARSVAATVAGVGAWLAAAGALHVPPDLTWSVLAVAALGLVVLAHAVSAPAGPARSTGLTGHGLGLLVIVAVGGTNWGLVVAVSAATVGWAVSGWRDLRDVSPVGDALASVHAVGRVLPLGLAAVGAPAAFSLLLDRLQLLPITGAWSIMVPSGAALAYAAASGLPMPLRLARVLAHVGFALGLVSPVLASERMPAVLGLVTLMVTVAVLPRAHRLAAMTWVAWAAPAAAVYLLGPAVWPGVAALAPGVWFAVTLGAVGTALLIPGVLLTALRSEAGPGSRASVPVVIGALEVGAGFAIGVVGHTGPVSGWLCAGTAVVVVTVGLLTRIGMLGGISAVLGWWAALLLVGDEINRRPWLAVLVTAVLLLAAQALSAHPSKGQFTSWFSHWDVPVLVAAIPVAATALVLGQDSTVQPLCWAGVGVQCVAVAIRLRHTRSLSAVLSGIGTVLIVIGAGTAGPGWLALVLLGLSGALSALSAVVRDPLAVPLRCAGAAAAVGAGTVALDWLGWGPQPSVDAAAIVGALAFAVVAALARLLPNASRGWWGSWGGAAAVVEAAAGTSILVTSGPGSAAPSWPIAAGLMVSAVALALLAAPMRHGWLCDLAAGYAAVALLVALSTAHLSSTTETWVVSGVGAASAIAVLTIADGPRAPAWQRPILWLGGLATGWAVWTASLSGPRTLALPLLVAAVLATAAGVALHRVGLRLLSSALACAAWVSFAHASFDERPEWATAPAGLTALVAVGLVRRDRARRGRPVASSEIVVLELAGIALLVGPFLVSGLTAGPLHVVAGLVVGLVIAGWGVVTEVRRRVAAGAASAFGAAVVLVAAPLVDLVPRWQGAALWVLIAVVGLVAVIAAAFVERAKAVARQGLARLAEATAGWE